MKTIGPVRVPADLPALRENAQDKLRRRPIADLREMPRTVVGTSDSGTLYRYDRPKGVRRKGLPLLFVPPLAAPAYAFDLRRGNSIIEYFVNQGRPVYLVDYGPVKLRDKRLGIEHWVDTVVPAAVEHVSLDAATPSRGAPDVHVAAWSLGGIFITFSAAAHPELPIASLTAVATPFDLYKIPLFALARPFNNAGIKIAGNAYRIFGGIPAPLTRLGFEASAIDKYLTKWWAMLTHADDRDFLAQLEAVDRFMSNMYGYPGRTFGQLYYAAMRTNEFASGTLKLAGRPVDLAKVRVPVLAVAGMDDTLAPRAAVEHLMRLVPNSRDAQLVAAPGGHLGVLTGRGAKKTTWPAINNFLTQHDSRK